MPPWRPGRGGLGRADPPGPPARIHRRTRELRRRGRVHHLAQPADPDQARRRDIRPGSHRARPPARLTSCCTARSPASNPPAPSLHRHPQSRSRLRRLPGRRPLGIDTTAITFPHVSSWAGTDPRARPAATIQAVTARILAAAALINAHLDAETSPHRPVPRAPTPARALQASRPQPPVPAGRDLVRVHDRPPPRSSAASCPAAGCPATWPAADSGPPSRSTGRPGTHPPHGTR